MTTRTPVRVPCPACGGYGRTPPSHRACLACDGHGVKWWDQDDPLGGCRAIFVSLLLMAIVVGVGYVVWVNW